MHLQNTHTKFLFFFSHAVIAGYAIGSSRFHSVITEPLESSTLDNDMMIIGGTEERICASWVSLSYKR